ncbi:ABC transporter substrate-binding protein [Vannielia sp.]|uniref:ABC transporter substrate-binding protein n=1 Tax=Vannielia sp. TaxID=2813045 RepID=UPI0026158DD5|nr:ABC transporter substrate-binding protein [Vannielia sp.]MDF1873742.1 ABC transporter substrate-binding protein [Vannielia sp.]
MPGFAQSSDKWLAGALMALWLAAAPAWAWAGEGGVPQRVVSINLCTDQLAMAVAAPGQLVSVTHMAQDPATSPVAEAAQAYRGNGARAEEVYALEPDLVLAGAFTAPETRAMLGRLGLRVEVFAPAERLEDIPANIRRMGKVLGREAAAEKMAQSFEDDLAAIDVPGGARPLAALYSANGWSAGGSTLPGQIVQAAGFDLLASELMLDYGGFVPLEVLAVSDPDVVIASTPASPKSRAEEILAHPVVQKLRAAGPVAQMGDASWICGTPDVLATVKRLAALRRGMP